MAVDRGPIFIGGLDRCGKTTLRAFLVSHPNISISAVGSNMWTYFYGQYGDLRRGDNFERCLNAMLHYKHVAFLNPDPDRIRKEFWRGEPTYARLFALFQEHFAEREGKPRWGDQTGLIERYADHVFAAYPGVKMLHMIRDPRDRYEASLDLWPKGRGRVGGATARWLYSVDLARRNLKRYPGRYKIVRFETLIHQMEKTLREVCAFLDEEFFPAMMTMENALSHREKLSQGLNGTPGGSLLSADFIGRFRQVIPKTEVAFMQIYAGREMLAYEYQLEPINFSTSEKLNFYSYDWPVNFFRMLYWRSMEAIQHNYPALLGRKLGSRMIV